MKLLIILAMALAAVALARPDGDYYDSKYDNFNVDEITDNKRLLKSYAHCFIGDGPCTAEGKEIRSWIPEATQSSCGKCTEKQKVVVAKAIKALKEKLPEEHRALLKKVNPEGKNIEGLNTFVAKYAP